MLAVTVVVLMLVLVLGAIAVPLTLTLLIAIALAVAVVVPVPVGSPGTVRRAGVIVGGAGASGEEGGRCKQRQHERFHWSILLDGRSRVRNWHATDWPRRGDSHDLGETREPPDAPEKEAWRPSRQAASYEKRCGC